MQSCLSQIADWDRLAEASGWTVHGLAAKCGVTPRSLERFLGKRTGLAVRVRLRELRQMRAILYLRAGAPVKQVAYELAFRQPSHFTRQFKQFYGMPPHCARTPTLSPGVAFR